MKNYYVYMLSNKYRGILYAGVTSDLIKRIYEHKSKITDGFTSKYNLNRLVYFESHDDSLEAIKREKQIKRWRRAWKIELIEKINPDWKDLYGDIVQ